MNRDALADFVHWTQANITGDEKSQAQIFLDRLFQAFGQPGCIEIGGQLEYRLKKDAEAGGNTAFADYVWKPVVLIEMKKRGADLRRHYRQAFDYWTRLVPNRPRYVILCNFDEFHVYDFETQMDAPVDTLRLHELPDRFGAMAFLAPGNPAPVFNNDRVAVTRQAADRLAGCFSHLVSRGTDRDLAQRFILQMLVALFAEDIGLLEKHFVTRLLDDCADAAQSYDLIGGLFRAMNSNPPTAGGRYKGVPYFNGGLFAHPACIELDIIELNHLREAAREDWSKVQPEIFGTLFQHSMDATERHAFGAHFTHPADIMKIVGPTIVEPWRQQIESAATVEQLDALLGRLHQFRVLDPACGSGNFLYIAYRELKRLEARLFERINELSPKKARDAQGQMHLSYLSARNFYGLDILPFAVEIAKVTMMIARKLAIDEVHITENALPLDNLDQNFLAVDALLTPDGLPAAWPPADVIIGNPPFLGAKRLKPEHGPDYVNQLRRAYPEIPGMADFCVYWFRKANDHLPSCTPADPLAGRAGLVGTQNIRNNQSRVGGLDPIAKSGTIIEAVDNQPWSGEANVHVSIANWVKTQDPALLPETRKLWYKVAPAHSATRRTRGQGSAAKEFDLNVRECGHINSALSDQADVGTAAVLGCNAKPQRVFRGQEPGNRGFVLTNTERAKVIGRDAQSTNVIFPHLIGRDLMTGDGKPTRWVIDFGNMNQLEAAQYEGAFEHIKTTVMNKMIEIDGRNGKRGDGATFNDQFLRARLDKWWLFRRACTDTILAISTLHRYIACSRHGKRPVFTFMAPLIRPDSAVQVFAFQDDYSFGILQSYTHCLWFIMKCSKLKSDFRYTPESVFDTFPWPQAPTVSQIEAVAAAGCEVRKLRAETLPKLKGGLRALYRTLELPGQNPLKDAHAALDAAVLAAYGFDAKADLLAQLLALNQAVAARIAANQPVTAPGLPPAYPTPAKLVTPDCIRPPSG